MTTPAFTVPKVPAEQANGLKDLMALLAASKGAAAPAPGTHPEVIRRLLLRAATLLLSASPGGEEARTIARDFLLHGGRLLELLREEAPAK